MTDDRKADLYVPPPDALTERQKELWELAIRAPLGASGLRQRWATLALQELEELVRD